MIAADFEQHVGCAALLEKHGAHGHSHRTDESGYPVLVGLDDVIEVYALLAFPRLPQRARLRAHLLPAWAFQVIRILDKSLDHLRRGPFELSQEGVDVRSRVLPDPVFARGVGDEIYIRQLGVAHVWRHFVAALRHGAKGADLAVLGFQGVVIVAVLHHLEHAGRDSLTPFRHAWLVVQRGVLRLDAQPRARWIGDAAHEAAGQRANGQRRGVVDDLLHFLDALVGHATIVQPARAIGQKVALEIQPVRVPARAVLVELGLEHHVARLGRGWNLRAAATLGVDALAAAHVRARCIARAAVSGQKLTHRRGIKRV